MGDTEDKITQQLSDDDDDDIDEIIELLSDDDEAADETFGEWEEYDDEDDALLYAQEEGKQWRREFAENMRRLETQKHFYSDIDEYVEEQDSVSGATVRLVPGMHLCNDEDK